MPELHRVIGDARLTFYRRLLPWGATIITAVFFAATVIALDADRAERAAAMATVTSVAAIIALLAWDVVRMLGKMERHLKDPSTKP